MLRKTVVFPLLEGPSIIKLCAASTMAQVPHHSLAFLIRSMPTKSQRKWAVTFPGQTMQRSRNHGIVYTECTQWKRWAACHVMKHHSLSGETHVTQHSSRQWASQHHSPECQSNDDANPSIVCWGVQACVSNTIPSLLPVKYNIGGSSTVNAMPATRWRKIRDEK